MLKQTIRHLEVLVIGDGAGESTRNTLKPLCRKNKRIKFFDFPKHERRGEPNRHKVLMEHARGEIVCYLTDHDLYLPDHVARFHKALTSADFAHSLMGAVQSEGAMIFPSMADLENRAEDRAAMLSERNLLPLDFGGHTLDFYKRRKEVYWQTTPPAYPTDGFFFSQMLKHGRVKTIYDFTVIYLPRPIQPKRNDPEAYLIEIRGWHKKLQQKNFAQLFRQHSFEQLVSFNSLRREQVAHYQNKLRELGHPDI